MKPDPFLVERMKAPLHQHGPWLGSLLHDAAPPSLHGSIAAPRAGRRSREAREAEAGTMRPRMERRYGADQAPYMEVTQPYCMKRMRLELAAGSVRPFG